MIQTKDIRFGYHPTHSLNFPDLNCQKGEKWLLLGQSGSGKTTFLHLLGGLLTPQSGKIFVNDTDLTTLRKTDLDRFRGKNIGVIFQTAHFVKALSVFENLALAQNLVGEKADKSLIANILDRLNLAKKINTKPHQLSVGEAQRVAIARALVNKPSVILADEPTSALDDENALDVVNLLESQAAEVGATLLIVTHDGRLKSHFPNQIALTH